MNDALRRTANRLIDETIARGYAYADVPVRLPADEIADLPGSGLHGRGIDAGDGSFLRADLTVPLALAYAGYRSGDRVCAAGPVFAPECETLQVGFERFGAAAGRGAGLLCLNEARETLKMSVHTVFNDYDVIRDLLRALTLSAPRIDRLCASLWSRSGTEALLQRYAKGLETEDIPPAPDPRLRLPGGRTAADLAARLHAKAVEHAEPPAAPGIPELIRRILTLRVPAASAAEATAALFEDIPPGSYDVPALDSACEHLRARAREAEAGDSGAVFDASLGRSLAYYTGFVFQLHLPDGRTAAAGGRYDGLVHRDGAPVPAAGGAFFPQVTV